MKKSSSSTTNASSVVNVPATTDMKPVRDLIGALIAEGRRAPAGPGGCTHDDDPYAWFVGYARDDTSHFGTTPWAACKRCGMVLAGGATLESEAE